jgi:hypothetical protein
MEMSLREASSVIGSPHESRLTHACYLPFPFGVSLAIRTADVDNDAAGGVMEAPTCLD